jgi:hypothetical protein
MAQNHLRRDERIKQEDAHRAKIETMLAARWSYTRIAKAIGWSTKSGRAAKTKVSEAVKRWRRLK